MKKIVSLLSAIIIITGSFSSVALADEIKTDALQEENVLISAQEPKEENEIIFTDMPDNWTTSALHNAVKNGLLNGYENNDGTFEIKPDNNIKRSEMATILVRAFGATKEADLSKFSDVTKDKWYYSAFAKAVQMKIFAGDDTGKLNPENFITYQEAFTVVSRLFVVPIEIDSAKKQNQDIKCLEGFIDYSSVDDWAKQAMANIVGLGYWNGIDNKLKPKDYITRSEFAVLMDNLIKNYINEPGTYSQLADGNTLIRSENVVLENIENDDIIIIGDGIQGVTNFNNVSNSNFIVCRGGEFLAKGGILNNISIYVSDKNIDFSKLDDRKGLFYACVPGVIVTPNVPKDLSFEDFEFEKTN